MMYMVKEEVCEFLGPNSAMKTKGALKLGLIIQCAEFDINMLTKPH